MSRLELAGSLYRAMLKIRRVEERIVAIYPSDKIQSPIHLSIGQEAVSAGVCLAMKPADRIYGTYRGHGLFIAKGGDLRKLFAELYGKEAGCARGKGGSMHLVAPETGLMGCSAIVASTIPVATGDALASEMQGRPRTVVAFFGDGAVEEGVFFESFNFAVLKNLPILFVCENNHYAIHSKLSDRRKQTELYRIGEGFGLKGKRFNGDNALEVHEATCEALEKIGKGKGPQLLEFVTCRWSEHVGPGMDHNEAYRDQEELRHALSHDPLEEVKSLLLAEKFTEPHFKKWETEIQKEIEEAVDFAEKSPFPTPEALWEDLYKENDEPHQLWSGR